jgi:hypothetical protein
MIKSFLNLKTIYLFQPAQAAKTVAIFLAITLSFSSLNRNFAAVATFQASVNSALLFNHANPSETVPVEEAPTESTLSMQFSEYSKTNSKLVRRHRCLRSISSNLWVLAHQCVPLPNQGYVGTLVSTPSFEHQYRNGIGAPLLI